jgi:hypothetical protein
MEGPKTRSDIFICRIEEIDVSFAKSDALLYHFSLMFLSVLLSHVLQLVMNNRQKHITSLNKESLICQEGSACSTFAQGGKGITICSVITLYRGTSTDVQFTRCWYGFCPLYLTQTATTQIQPL